MNLEQRVDSFTHLGLFLSQFTTSSPVKNKNVLNNNLFFEDFNNLLLDAQHYNQWFTLENVIHAVSCWSKLLEKNTIKTWLNPYNFAQSTPKRVALIMAGNLPLVGFHDFLSVLICGQHAIVKLSSNDKQLLPFIAKYLIKLNPEYNKYITFSEEKLPPFDAVIATGSNNTSRYFEFYFRNKPSIIRKNRNSVAVLTGNESQKQLEALSEDVFRYFGLGCRNVSKIYVPRHYNFEVFFKAMSPWHHIINHNKYANNYDYNKAVYIMSDMKILDNGFLILKEDDDFASPIATLFYEYYDSIDQLKLQLSTYNDRIQCVISKANAISKFTFGKSQTPELWEYADGVDTVDFLLEL